MATLRKIGNNYYVRIRLPGGREKTVSTGTGNRREAEQFLKLAQENLFLVKLGLKKESELEDLELQDATKRFIRERKLKGLRKTTIDSYDLALKNLVAVNGPRLPVTSLTKDHLQKMVAKLKEKKLADHTINIRIRSVNAFTSWLLSEEYIQKPVKVSQIKVDRPAPKFITPDELERLFAQKMKPKMLSTFRVYACLGLRLGELHHCKLDNGFVIVPAEHSKSRRDRYIPIPADMIKHFEIATDNPFRPHSITRAFRRYADRAKIPPEKTFHGLRYAYALHQHFVEKKSVIEVRELMGHSAIDTTMIYLNHPGEYVKKLMEKSDSKPDNHIVGQA